MGTMIWVRASFPQLDYLCNFVENRWESSILYSTTRNDERDITTITTWRWPRCSAWIAATSHDCIIDDAGKPSAITGNFQAEEVARTEYITWLPLDLASCTAAIKVSTALSYDLYVYVDILFLFKNKYFYIISFIYMRNFWLHARVLQQSSKGRLA